MGVKAKDKRTEAFILATKSLGSPPPGMAFFTAVVTGALDFGPVPKRESRKTKTPATTAPSVRTTYSEDMVLKFDRGGRIKRNES